MNSDPNQNLDSQLFEFDISMLLSLFQMFLQKLLWTHGIVLTVLDYKSRDNHM